MFVARGWTVRSTIGGLVAVIACVVLIRTAGWFAWQQPSSAEIVLRDSSEPLASEAIRILGFEVPKAGSLTIEATSDAGEPFTLYLVTRSSDRSKPHEYRMIQKFSGENVIRIRKSANVERGEYTIMLLRPLPKVGPPTSIRVRVRLAQHRRRVRRRHRSYSSFLASGVPEDASSPPPPGKGAQVFSAFCAMSGALVLPSYSTAAAESVERRDTLVYKNGDRIVGSVMQNSPDLIVFRSERFGELRAKPTDAVVILGEKEATAAASAPSASAEARASEAMVNAQREAERVSTWDRFSASVLTARVREFFGPWKGRLALSVEDISDITEKKNASFERQLRRKWERDGFQLTARFDYAETTAVPTTDLLKVAGSWRHEFTKNHFIHYRPSSEWNRASKRQSVPNDYVLLQQELSVGYHIFASPTCKLRTGVAQNRFDTWNTAPSPDHISRSVQSTFEEIELKLPWRIGITQRGVWYPVPDQLDGWENRIEVNKKLTETLSTAFRHEIRRHNPDGSAQDYTKTKLLLAFDF